METQVQKRAVYLVVHRKAVQDKFLLVVREEDMMDDYRLSVRNISDKQLAEIGRKNFENWFYLYEAIAGVIYHSAHYKGWTSGANIRGVTKCRIHFKDLGKILRRGVGYGCLEGGHSNFRLTYQGRKFFKENFVDR